MSHLDCLEEQIALFDAQIAQHISLNPTVEPEAPTASRTSLSSDEPSVASPEVNPTLNWETAITLLDTIPGVARQTAELLLAEIGCDMSRFPSDAHLAKWAKLCPGNCRKCGIEL